jgi:hypothetical protein
MSESYEQIKNKIQQELNHLEETGVISKDENVTLSSNLITIEKEQKYIDISEPITTNEKSHSLYGREDNYLNKKMIDTESGNVFIKTENNLYLKSNHDGEVELINKENIETESDITWSIIGLNSNFVRFANKNGAYLRAYSNLTVKTPLLLTGEDDIENNTNLWKLIKKNNVYLLENSFYKNNFLDNTLKISETETNSKRWILESIPLVVNITYDSVIDNYEIEKKEIIDKYILLKNQRIENNIILEYLKILKQKAINISNNNNTNNTNNTNNNSTNFEKERTNYIETIELLKSNLIKDNKVIDDNFIDNVLENLENQKEEFIIKLILELNVLKTSTFTNKNKNHLTKKNIENKYEKSNKSVNNINFIDDKYIVMNDNIFIFKENNDYLTKKKHILFISIICLCIILLGFAVNIINDIYKIANDMN